MSVPGGRSRMSVRRCDCCDVISVAELERTALRPVVSPLPSAVMLIRDALQGGRLQTPAVWRSAILARLRARDIEAFAPLADPGGSGWPSLLDDVRGPREGLGQALERVAAITGDALLEALEGDRDMVPTAAWDRVREQPEAWRARYVDAIHRGWGAIEPLWRRSGTLLEREVERIESAIAHRVSVAQIANELLPSSELVGDVWRLTRSPESRRLRLAAEGLAVTPFIGFSVGTLSAPGDVLLRFSYPVRDAWRAFDDQGPPPTSLQALLGRQRTRLLERLDRPRTAGELAEQLRLSPSATTFHLRALEAAGLIDRHRSGRNVVVTRTHRGTRLLALYGDP